MSSRFTLLAAAVAFCGLSAVAQAQSGGGGTGTGGADSSSTMTSGGGAAAGGTAMRGNRPMRAQRQAMRGNRGAMRGARPANDANAAYMGGGAVYERGADGSLRPVN